MAPRNAVAGPYAKQAVRFLQLCSLVLLALGILNQLPIPGVGPNLLFIPADRPRGDRRARPLVHVAPGARRRSAAARARARRSASPNHLTA